MLKFFRKKLIAKIIFWGILIVIVSAFVLWGMPNIGSRKNKGPSFVGTIFDKKVSFDELGKSIVSIRSQIILNYFAQPDTLNALLKNKPFLAKLAWDRLIMLKKAQKYGIRIPDNEVINAIRTHPLFVRDGKFEDRIYQYTLRYNMALSLRQFEEIVRENLAIQRLNDIVTKDEKATDEEILEEYAKENGTFKISYIVVELKDFTKDIKIEEDAIKDYYEKHRAEIMVRPSSPDDKTPARQASFEESKDKIKSFLEESQAAGPAYEHAEGLYNKIKELMVKESLSFDDAAAKLNLTTFKTPLFSKSDKLTEIPETAQVASAASNLEIGEVSRPIPLQNGFMILSLLETGKPDEDEEKFKKEKDTYAKKALDKKKNKALEAWLRKLENDANPNIDFNDYEKYYQ